MHNLLAAVVMDQVEICIFLCAGGDGKKTAQDVVVATHEGTPSAVC